MDIDNQHQMVVKNTFPTGAQEWYCPTCGRRFILQWPPNYKRIILDEGDEQAIHSGGTGGLTMGAAEVEPAESENMESADSMSEDIIEDGGQISDKDDPYLSPFERWLGDQDL